MKHVLFLFTADFPLGKGETFLETEIIFLCAAFDEVRIITRAKGEALTRPIPDNATWVSIEAELSPVERIASLFNVFDARFREEVKIIRKIYKLRLTSGIIKTMLISLQQAKRIRKVFKSELAKTGSNDKVVSYSYWCDDAAIALAMEREENRNLKAICRIHRWDVYFEESAVSYLPFRRYIADHLNKIFSISQDGIDYAVKTWQVDQQHFALSRLGIQNEADPVASEEKSFNIVSCSNMIPVKRVGLIVEALKGVDAAVTWTHIGDGPEMEAIRKQAEALPENITVDLKGRVSNPEIYNIYKTLKPDLFINVSSSEGVPVSIMEAMSFGIPVIATAVGGTPEIVNDSNGDLLPANPDAEEVARAIRHFMALNPEDRNAKRQAAYKTWEEEYNAEKNYRAFVDELMRL